MVLSRPNGIGGFQKKKEFYSKNKEVLFFLF